MWSWTSCRRSPSSRSRRACSRNPVDVVYQNTLLFLLCAFGLEGAVPATTFDTLREYGLVQLMLHGASATKLAVGPGLEGMGRTRGNYVDACEFAVRHNSGQFGAKALTNLLPAAVTDPGMIVHDLLNFYNALSEQGGGCFWRPFGVADRAVFIITSAFDGMMIKQGGRFFEGTMEIFGPVDGPVSYDEARRLDKMDDDEVRNWLAQNPMATEVIEVRRRASCLASCLTPLLWRTPLLRRPHTLSCRNQQLLVQPGDARGGRQQRRRARGLPA